MNKSIWKYQLEITDSQTIKMPKGAEILSVQTQNQEVCLWALVVPNNEKEDRYIEIFGTGHNVYCDMGIDRKFIGTAQTLDGRLVWHIFERVS